MIPTANYLTGRLLRLPLRLIPKRAVVPVLSGINRGFRWQVGAGTHGYWVGTYERWKQEPLRELVKPGMTAWDIGANAGFYTLAMSRMVGPKGRVVAFEPLPANLRFLQLHVALNGCANVAVRDAAVCESSGDAMFAFGSDRAEGHLSAHGQIHVKTLAIDDLIAAGEPVPDVIKIDIEGAEMAALRGARKLLAARRSVWVIALDDASTNEPCRRLLLDAGYRIDDLSINEIIATAPS